MPWQSQSRLPLFWFSHVPVEATMKHSLALSNTELTRRLTDATVLPSLIHPSPNIHTHQWELYPSRGFHEVPLTGSTLALVLWVLVGTVAQSGMAHLASAFIFGCYSQALPSLPPITVHAGRCYSLTQPNQPLAPALMQTDRGCNPTHTGLHLLLSLAPARGCCRLA